MPGQKARLLAVLLFFYLPGVVIRAEEISIPKKDPAATTTLRVRTDLMEIRAVVMDAKGRPVENLAREDFELYENNQLQEIALFAVSQVNSEAKKAPESKTKTPGNAAPVTQAERLQQQMPLRSTVLLVDNLHLSFSNLNRVKAAIRKFIDERMTGQDRVALATSAGTLGIAQRFTGEKQILRHALEQIRYAGSKSDSLFSPRLAADVVASHEMAIRTAALVLKQEENLSHCCHTLREMATARASQIMAEASLHRASTVATLKAYAEQMADLPGRRMIVLFSDGFPLLAETGQQSSELQPVISRAVRSGVAIYSVDAKGLQTSPTVDASKRAVAIPAIPNWASTYDPSKNTRRRSKTAPQTNAPSMNDEADMNDDFFSSNCIREEELLCIIADPLVLENYQRMAIQEASNGMHSLAAETGGTLFENDNNLASALNQAFDANRYYYVLSYYLNDTASSRFRNIRVKVRNHPEYKVRAPRGYSLPDAAAKPDAAVKSPQQRLLQAMQAPLPVTDINVSARAEFLEMETDDKQVTLLIYFDGDKLNYLDRDAHSRVEMEILYTVQDASGKQISAIAAAVEGNLTSERKEEAQSSGFLFTQRLAYKPGAYLINVGVREKDKDLMGTASAWIEVPKILPDKLEMSSLILRNPLDSTLDETIDVNALAEARMIQGVPLYKRGDFFDYYFRVFPGRAPASPDAGFRVMKEVLRQGKTVREESWALLTEEEKNRDGKGWFDVGGAMNLADLESGIYEVRVTVKDAQTNKTAQRTAVFSIE